MSVKNQKCILAVEVPPEERGVPAHTRLPILEHQCWEGEFPQQLAANISRDSDQVKETSSVDPGISLKASSKDLLAQNKHLPLTLEKGQQLKK